jgi:peptidoglycan/LPS O-acetylase OafA/YrhL
MQYRADIDGLRAIAVLSVLFYHAGLGFPGGYVGVDVFFVISGYLITSLILKDLERGSFSMASFWERRIRRIFPALAVMLAVTCVAGWFLLLPEDLAKLGASVIAQSLLVSNFYFWRTTNYFGGANEEKPLLHTWSLAVEEQFYLIFPIALMAFWWAWSRWQKAQADRRSKFGDRTLDASHSTLDSSLATSDSLPATSPIGEQRRWALFWLFTAVALLSFGLSIWGVKAQPFATFFLLPTRAWELLLGSMLAVLPPTVVVRSSALREILCLAGLAGILIPVFFYGEQTPFPGLAALPPCLGTAALIWANTLAKRDSKPTWAAVALSCSPIVYIGLISYSLYLWHWPIICYSSYWAVQEFTLTEKSIVIFASFIIAIASWKFVECPFRAGRRQFKATLLFKTAAFTTSFLCFIGGTIIYKKGLPERFSEGVRTYLSALEHEKNVVKTFEKNKYKRLAGVEGLLTDNPIQLGCPKNSPSFILFGDSHARYIAPLFHEVANLKGVSGNLVSHTATPPLISWEHKFRRLSYEDPDHLFKETLKYAKENNITIIFLAAYWSTYQKHGGIQPLEKALSQTMKQLQKEGFQVYFLFDHPTYNYNVPKNEIRAQIFPFLTRQDQTLEQHKSKNSAVYDVLNVLQNVNSLDPTDKFLKPGQDSFSTSIDQIPLYLDDNHLTHAGVCYAWGEQVQSVFEKLIGKGAIK